MKDESINTTACGFALSAVHCPPSTFRHSQSSIFGMIGVLAAIFACAAGVFAWRRFSGALVNPLPVILLMPAGILGSFSVLGLRTLWRRSYKRTTSPRADLILDILLGASLLIFASALSLPGTNAWGLGGFWLLIAAEESCAWLPRARHWRNRRWGKKNAPEQFRVDPPQSAAPHAGPIEVALPEVIDSATMPALSAQGVTQQLTRSATADGCDLLSGLLRLDFAAGQRMGNLHVAFCPPFTKTPELSVSQLDGPETRIKIAQLLPYGVRLDLKRVNLSDQPANVLVQFSARASNAGQGY